MYITEERIKALTMKPDPTLKKEEIIRIIKGFRAIHNDLLNMGKNLNNIRNEFDVEKFHIYYTDLIFMLEHHMESIDYWVFELTKNLAQLIDFTDFVVKHEWISFEEFHAGEYFCLDEDIEWANDRKDDLHCERKFLSKLIKKKIHLTSEKKRLHSLLTMKRWQTRQAEKNLH